MSVQNAIVVQLLGATEERHLLVPGEEVLVGRSLQARLPVDDTSVSRRHCRLILEGGRVFVDDLASANGTFVNDERVERAELNTGDVLRLGDSRFEICLLVNQVPELEFGDIHTLEFRGTNVPRRLAEVGYTLGSCFARSGLVSVYRAMRLGHAGPVTVKVLDLVGGASVQQQEAFAAGIEVQSRLDHPRVPKVLDVRRGPDLLAVVMEHVEGHSLERAIKRHGVIRSWQALDLGYRVATALKALHARGYVHRDVTPSNVLLTVEGEVRLIDFGLAAPRGVAHRGVGTPGYRAPEQVSGAPTDERADLYGLGATLVYALTGYAPREGHSIEMSGSLGGVFNKLLARDPKDRYESVDGFLRAVEALTGEHSGLPADSECTEFLLRLAADDDLPTHQWRQETRTIAPRVPQTTRAHHLPELHGSEGEQRESPSPQELEEVQRLEELLHLEEPPQLQQPQQHLREDMLRASLRGQIRARELIQLLCLIERSRLSGRVVISAGVDHNAVLLCADGRLKRALCGEASGAKAVHAALALVPAGFTFVRLQPEDVQGDVDLSLKRVLSEWASESGDGSAA